VALDPASRSRFNLQRAAVLLVDATPLGMNILVQIIAGLGAKTIYRCATREEAEEAVRTRAIDLAIVDAMPPMGEGYEFVRWLRMQGPEINRYAPVLMTAGHTPVAQVELARDCGAHFVVRRPLSAMGLLERIIWVAREGRAFVIDDSYVGPDRRFRTEPGEGHDRRREDRLAPADETPPEGEPASKVAQ
jgi:DNA-binding response OmpR family regulator